VASQANNPARPSAPRPPAHPPRPRLTCSREWYACSVPAPANASSSRNTASASASRSAATASFAFSALPSAAPQSVLRGHAERAGWGRAGRRGSGQRVVAARMGAARPQCAGARRGGARAAARMRGGEGAVWRGSSGAPRAHLDAGASCTLRGKCCIASAAPGDSGCCCGEAPCGDCMVPAAVFRGPAAGGGRPALRARDQAARDRWGCCARPPKTNGGTAPNTTPPAGAQHAPRRGRPERRPSARQALRHASRVRGGAAAAEARAPMHPAPHRPALRMTEDAVTSHRRGTGWALGHWPRAVTPPRRRRRAPRGPRPRRRPAPPRRARGPPVGPPPPRRAVGQADLWQRSLPAGLGGAPAPPAPLAAAASLSRGPITATVSVRLPARRAAPAFQ
jgi:hypothetical protein